MAIQYYFSTDASAPTLNGTVGSLITLLDACLVNGYGSKTAAGWTKEYSGTNLAAYRMSTVSPATGMYLRVDDTGTTTARVLGYETMSDVNTGTNRFPLESQVSGGSYIWKSVSANSTARPWAMVACERSFYLFTLTNKTTLDASYDNYSCQVFFGDIVTRKATDGYQCMIIAPTGAINNDNQMLAGCGVPISWHYIARPYTGLGTSTQVGKCRCLPAGYNNQSVGLTETGVFPDAVSQTLILGKVMVSESNVIMRGFMPGMYDPVGGRNAYAGGFDIVQGQGNTSGTTFVVLPTYYGGNDNRAWYQVSGSWY